MLMKAQTTTKPPAKAARATTKAAAPAKTLRGSKTVEVAATAQPVRKARGTKIPTVVAAPAPTGTSKQAQLIQQLHAGATIEQMMTLTGWQAHTVRGTISGVLRKRLGLNVMCEACTAGGSRVYRIVGTQA
jgi:hypothetical protein